MTPEIDALLRRCDRYLDLVPRESAEPSDVGPLRVFLSRVPWPYYARPRPELDLTSAGAVTVEDVRGAAGLLEALEHAVSFEWIVELVPSMHDALTQAEYVLTQYPLLVRGLGDLHERPALPALPAPTVRLLDADSPDLLGALAVSEVAFAAPGTATGEQGSRSRDETEVDPALVEHVRERVGSGLSVIAAAYDPDHGVVAVGWHQPVGAETEIVGVATLPSHRRRGLAALVVDALVRDAAARGCTLALLSAGDDAVARVYERAGFRRVGTCGAAEPAPAG